MMILYFFFIFIPCFIAHYITYCVCILMHIVKIIFLTYVYNCFNGYCISVTGHVNGSCSIRRP